MFLVKFSFEILAVYRNELNLPLEHIQKKITRNYGSKNGVKCKKLATNPGPKLFIITTSNVAYWNRICQKFDAVVILKLLKAIKGT